MTQAGVVTAFQGMGMLFGNAVSFVMEYAGVDDIRILITVYSLVIVTLEF